MALGVSEVVSSPKVAILMATFNGERFLPEQLNSILGQTHTDWTLWISDDGSTDATRKIVEDFQRRSGNPDRVRLVEGPRKGHAANFMSLVAGHESDADYFCYADQDDVWCATKLADAIASLGARIDEPILYCGRTTLIDAVGSRIGVSPNFNREIGFENALIQSLASGNTMMFTRALWVVLSEVPTTVQVFAHDWFTYLAATATGAKVIYDERPTVLYRQHENNAVGGRMGLSAKASSVGRLLSGAFSERVSANIEALRFIAHHITPRNSKVLSDFQMARRAFLPERLIKFQALKLRPQTRMDNLSLWLGVVVNRI